MPERSRFQFEIYRVTGMAILCFTTASVWITDDSSNGLSQLGARHTPRQPETPQQSPEIITANLLLISTVDVAQMHDSQLHLWVLAETLHFGVVLHVPDFRKMLSLEPVTQSTSNSAFYTESCPSEATCD